MNRVSAHVRSLVRTAVVCSVAGVVLASCATSTVTKSPRVSGLPAISISVPLSSVACTTDNSCVALGTSNLDVSPTSVGEYRSANGRWSPLTVRAPTLRRTSRLRRAGAVAVSLSDHSRTRTWCGATAPRPTRSAWQLRRPARPALKRSVATGPRSVAILVRPRQSEIPRH